MTRNVRTKISKILSNQIFFSSWKFSWNFLNHMSNRLTSSFALFDQKDHIATICRILLQTYFSSTDPSTYHHLLLFVLFRIYIKNFICKQKTTSIEVVFVFCNTLLYLTTRLFWPFPRLWRIFLVFLQEVPLLRALARFRSTFDCLCFLFLLIPSFRTNSVISKDWDFSLAAQ